MKAFLNDVILRPSCYQCKFKGLNRNSDITLADFWGIQHVIPEMDDDKGTSLVILHSEKGKEIFSMLSDKMACEAVDINEAVKHNPSMIRSAQMHKKRKQFFLHLEDLPFDRLVKKYAKKRKTLKQTIVVFLKKIGLHGIVIKLYKRLK